MTTLAPQNAYVTAGRLDAPGAAGARALDDLRQLMATMTRSSEALEATHAALIQQVARLQRELAEANDQLSRSRTLAELGQMAAGIAHEVRNPLASIGLYAQMLGEDLAGRPQQALSAKIVRAVADLDAVVRDVLAFARHQTLHLEHTAAGLIAQRAVAACQTLLDEGNIAVTAPPPESHPMRGDDGLLVQALTNVVRNAAQAMIEAGTRRPKIVVTALRQPRRAPDGRVAERVVIGVADRGPGVPAQVAERMFSPFFTTRKAGTGLGLAIVHRIVDAHGGHVAVSNPPGGGALIELCLPASIEEHAVMEVRS